jgi:hypothetical protein
LTRLPGSKHVTRRVLGPSMTQSSKGCISHMVNILFWVRSTMIRMVRECVVSRRAMIKECVYGSLGIMKMRRKVGRMYCFRSSTSLLHR